MAKYKFLLGDKYKRTGRFSMSELAEILEMDQEELQHQLDLAAEDEKRVDDNPSNPDL